jgi:hypothetical protein
LERSDAPTAAHVAAFTALAGSSSRCSVVLSAIVAASSATPVRRLLRPEARCRSDAQDCTIRPSAAAPLAPKPLLETSMLSTLGLDATRSAMISMSDASSSLRASLDLRR